MTDPIADLLTRIRNGQMARKEIVSVPHSRLKQSILDVLVKNAFIKGYKEVKEGQFKQINIELDTEKKLALKRISKPGQRIYVGKTDIGRVLNGYGISLISTSKGVITGAEARKQGIGGEVLCEIY